jgi:hypothetical protein
VKSRFMRRDKLYDINFEQRAGAKTLLGSDGCRAQTFLEKKNFDDFAVVDLAKLVQIDRQLSNQDVSKSAL